MPYNFKVLHLPSAFLPDNSGGKEVFVYNLSINLIRCGIQTSVLIHSGLDVKQYTYKEVSVRVLPSLSSGNYRKSYFSKFYGESPQFKEFLIQYKPTIVHFHDQSEGASLTHLRICKELGIKTLLTYHSPGQSCMQRALIYAGKEPCDGKIDITRCTSCRYQVKGIHTWAANLLAKLNLPVDESGKFLFRNSTNLYYDSWREFYHSVDAIQVHSHWVEDILINNGVEQSKIHFIAMGGHESLPKKEHKINDDPLKLVFLGRCTNIKGIHLLIDAVLGMSKEIKVEVHFFSHSWGDEYGKVLIDRIQGDSRFKAPIFVEADQVVTRLQQMDVCVIPSLWPETGPFTVFDAFAAGLPIIGTNHAGIAERVRHEINGLLFEWNNWKSLQHQILRLYHDRDLLFRLRRGILPNRTFEKMSQDFSRLYGSLLQKKNPVA